MVEIKSQPFSRVTRLAPLSTPLRGVYDLSAANRPFPSSKSSHFQNETNCKTFLVKMSFICMIITNHFHISSFAHSLSLWRKHRLRALTRKKPTLDYEATTSIPPFFLRDSRVSETRARVKITPRLSPFLAWGDFHARSRFARSTIPEGLPEEKWGTTRSLSLFTRHYLSIFLFKGSAKINPVQAGSHKFYGIIRVRFSTFF